MPQLGRRRTNPSSLHPFVLFRLSVHWVMPTTHGLGEGHLLYLFCFKCQSLPETASQKPPDMLLY